MIIKNNKQINTLYKGERLVVKIYKQGRAIVFRQGDEVVYDIDFTCSQSGKWKVNGIDIDVSGTRFQTNLEDIGIQEITDMSNSFFNIGFERFNSPFDGTKVNTLYSAFAYSPSTRIDINQMSLSSNLKDVRYAFMSCINARRIDYDVNAFKSQNLLSGLFGYNENLSSTNGKQWVELPTSSATTSMDYICYQCKAVETIVLKDGIENVTNFASAFEDCKKLKTIDGQWTNSKATNCNAMFKGCLTMDFPTMFTRLMAFNRDITTANEMFRQSSIGYKDWDNRYSFSSTLKKANYLFANCGFWGADANPTDILYTDTIEEIEGMFEGTSISKCFLNTNYENCINMDYMFRNCYELTEVSFEYGTFNNDVSMNGMFNNAMQLTDIYIGEGTMSQAVYNTLLRAVDETGRANSIAIHGYPSSSSDELYIITEPNTSITWNGNDYYADGDGVIRESGLSQTDDLDGWLYGNNEVKEIHSIPYADTVVNWDNAFYNCINLTTFDAENMSPQNIIGICQTFDGCESLERLDLSKWKDNSWDAYNAFANCINLEYLDLGEMEFQSTYNVDTMFDNCQSLYTLKWQRLGYQSNASELIFNDCPLGMGDSESEEALKNTFVWDSCDRTDYLPTMDLVFNSDTMSKFSEEELAIMSSKNYSIICL